MKINADEYFKCIIEYLKSDLSLFCGCNDFICEEISEGNINHIYRISDSRNIQSVIIKLAEPEANISKDIVIDTARGRNESELLMFYNRLIPGSAPEVLGYNEELCTIVMSDMKDCRVLQNCIGSIDRCPFIPGQMSDFLADLLFYTSDFYLDSKAKKNNQKKFINPDLCGITEKLVFSEPYDAEKINCTDKNKDFVRKNICENALLKKEAAELKYKFMTEAQSLIHGDLHFGSVFVNEKRIIVFDPEFSFYGPMGYDIGNIIAHFIIEYIIADFGIYNDMKIKQTLKDYLLKTVKLTFEKMMKHIKYEAGESELRGNEFAEEKLSGVLCDSSGYAGTECLRRITGIAKLKKIEELNSDVKSAVERRILETGILLIEKRAEIKRYCDFEKMINELL